MSPRTPKQFEKIRHDRRKSIMDTALEVFSENGYANASISMIAKKAGISKGLMYNYFKSKEELLSTIVLDGLNEMFELLDPNKDGVLTKEEFTYFIEEVFKLINEKRTFYKLYFSLMMQPSVWKLFEARLAEIIEPFMKITIDYYAKKGVENPLLESLLISALFDGIGFHYVFNPEQYPLDDIKKLLIERFV
ncbi:MAG: TetR/AcrR family transcriptional regulator [Bacteroidetes bacterium]|nr:MAG: TetR/AcrR family transcriptional regulator [Bacteroidota bacterium]RLD48720.1 MAG: TetR/AcrR family transcriptional regulator [Bacteroidota bacterium]RLD74044.1 MAG: TetR/AcrR family transcriptional regulator [Bacteroidota bacterium]RLD88942.1 MAG: TetR/AcrR family transcriptional regulator [Bacteroidota bacterium]